MNITIDLPREAEGKVKLNDKDRSVSIEPRFRQAGSLQPIGYVTVKGKSGAEKKFVLNISGSTGRVTVQELSDVESLFDKPAKNGKKEADEPAEQVG